MSRLSMLTGLLMLSAPFAAVVVGIYVFHSAWLALLLYHAQILLHAGPRAPQAFAALRAGWSPRWLLALGLPAALAAPAVLALLGMMLEPDLHLATWLSHHGLSGIGLYAFALDYGLLHPVLEQIHWDPLRRDPRFGRVAHFAFAGYHLLVLALLMRPLWMAVSFVVLLGASRVWAHVRTRSGGLIVPALSHVIADTAMIGAVLYLAGR